MICVCTGIALSVAAQVDKEQNRQDTLYIYDEEIIYDTLYVSDTLPDYSEMGKDELIEAFRSDRGIGRLYYKKGGLYLIGTDELYRLDKTDLKWLLSASEYEDYRKAKRNQYISIPLYVAGGGSLAMAGVGLYQFCASFILTAKANNQILESDNLGLDIWRCAMGGVFLFGGGLIATTAFMVPAVILTIKSKVSINRIVNHYSVPPTADMMQIRFGLTPHGAGVTLYF